MTELADNSVNNDCKKVLDHQYKDMDIDDLKQLLNVKTISKNQKKKILKQIYWLESADLRKEKRKKKKLQYKEMRLKNIEQGCAVKRFRTEKISTVQNFDSHYHIAIDLSFDRLMTNKDTRKLGKQISWCYKVNRRSSIPVQYHLCGLEGRLKGALDPSHVNWDLHFDKTVFDNSYSNKLVYLTAESSNKLSEVETGKVYVIGGLVDHNHQKGICQLLADRKHVSTARLPLEENIDIKTRKVLTVNHVFEILLVYIETRNWKEAILKVLPAKKFSTKPKHSPSSGDDISDANDSKSSEKCNSKNNADCSQTSTSTSPPSNSDFQSSPKKTENSSAFELRED